MRFSNLHTHSTFSDGKHSPEAIVQSAIEKNFISIGFSDHSYTACDESYCMRPVQYPAYHAELRALRDQYKAEIDVLIGLELDAYSVADRADYDYFIASVHYLCAGGDCYPIDHTRIQQEECIARLCGGRRIEMAKRYYDLVAEHVINCKPDVIGHFDVLTKFGLFDDAGDDYRRVAIEALDAAMKVCPVVEMNTGAISRKVRTVPYPQDFLLQRVLENGGEVILSADSHAKDTLDCCFAESVESLRKMGFDHIVYMDATGLHRQEI